MGQDVTQIGHAASIPSIAVIIPTFNSAGTLVASLESIRSQDVQASEVVVVDDIRTTDSTRSIAAEFGASVVVSPAGMSESRNIGVEKTVSPILLSLDSDMVIEPGLLRVIVSQFHRANLDAATVAEKAVGRGYWARARAIDKESVEATGFGRSVRVFRRSLFEAIGGYDAGLEAGEDADFHIRVVATGATVGHIAQPGILHNEGRLRLDQVARKKFRYGTTMPALEAKHSSRVLSNGFRARLVAGAFIAIGRDPIALPGFLILKLTDASAGLAGRRLARRRTAQAEGPADRIHGLGLGSDLILRRRK